MHDDLPLPGASRAQAARRYWTKYASFAGRASRSEFWWWQLISLLVGFAIEVVVALVVGDWSRYLDAPYWSATSAPGNLWALITLVPDLALGARRLHDIDRSGWWLLIAVVPIVGIIVLIVWWASSPVPLGARFDRTARRPGR